MPFDYDAQPKEAVGCPLCGTFNPSVPATDRAGFAIGGSTCACGFRYLNPRMTAAAYAEFYRADYRAIIAELDGKPHNARQLSLAQFAFGANLRAGLESWGIEFTDTTVLDVGGGDGSMLRGMGGSEVFDSDVLDPSNGGSPIEEAFFPEPAYDIVLCIQSVDHFLDPVRAMLNMRAALKPGGRLIITALNADTRARREPTHAWKIDHPCYFAPDTFRALIAKSGFTRERGWNFGKSAEQMGYVCR